MHLEEANLLENGCHRCNMRLKIGHGREEGHEERHNRERYVVFIPIKYSHFALEADEKK